MDLYCKRYLVFLLVFYQCKLCEGFFLKALRKLKNSLDTGGITLNDISNYHDLRRTAERENGDFDLNSFHPWGGKRSVNVINDLKWNVLIAFKYDLDKQEVTERPVAETQRTSSFPRFSVSSNVGHTNPMLFNFIKTGKHIER